LTGVARGRAGVSVGSSLPPLCADWLELLGVSLPPLCVSAYAAPPMTIRRPTMSRIA
jgi:hypothetical protein